ncbi:MAG: hypothetical protein MJA29_05775 [Candidatus Omnitrophica bacterium]|nr:hypothetical protein [Candidatus Omnitrophota bacterium]
MKPLHRQGAMILLAVLAVLLLFECSFAGLTFREAQRYLKEAVRFHKDGNYIAAKDAYHKAWRVAAHDTGYRKMILNNLGTLYMKTGSYMEAEEVFKEILAIDPSYQPARLNLGLVYERIKPPEEVREYWLKVFDIDPDRIIEENKPEDITIVEAVGG